MKIERKFVVIAKKKGENEEQTEKGGKIREFEDYRKRWIKKNPKNKTHLN